MEMYYKISIRCITSWELNTIRHPFAVTISCWTYYTYGRGVRWRYLGWSKMHLAIHVWYSSSSSWFLIWLYGYIGIYHDTSKLPTLHYFWVSCLMLLASAFCGSGLLSTKLRWFDSKIDKPCVGPLVPQREKNRCIIISSSFTLWLWLTVRHGFSMAHRNI